ncbi:M56 family metallopeptidase [Stackebrandtia soli]|uniref:M56 family metallopeptidase n=1 Tax=Stackebrandtia soli TaxID=1892856 RepID=UPI0039EC59DD
MGPIPAWLDNAAWATREPRAALILWQAIGLTAGITVLGAAGAMALAPLDESPLVAATVFVRNVAEGDLTGGLGIGHLILFALAFAMSLRLAVVLPVTVWRTMQARYRHRHLVGLVSSPWPAARPGHGHVLDHPVAAVYCLPGRVAADAPRIVFTSGALATLDDEELAAVLEHENAHLTERHDLVAMPFFAWVSAFGWFPGVRRSRAAVGTLLELVADDRAANACDPAALASALVRIGTAGQGGATPAGALAIDGTGVLLRVRRLLHPPPRSPRWRITAYAMAVGLVCLPAVVLLPVW